MNISINRNTNKIYVITLIETKLQEINRLSTKLIKTIKEINFNIKLLIDLMILKIYQIFKRLV